MRKLLISILLASAAATPALAAPRDFTDRQAARAEQQQARDDARSERASNRSSESSLSRSDRADRPADSRPQANDRPARVDPTERPTQSNLDAARASRDAARAQRVEQRQQIVDQRQQTVEQVRNANDLRQSTQPTPPVLHTRVPVVSDTPREGTQPPPQTVNRPSSAPQWSTNWRNNHRYDWSNYRRHHHSLFHLGFYYDPFGWGYYPYQIGWRLWPSYYGSNYWINDPWQYRLPYAPPGYVWIRYWDDALLVDTWSGQVVDMIPNFFW